MRRPHLTGLVCALVLAAVGCSDEEEPESRRATADDPAARTAPPSTTKGAAGLSAAEYRRRINALCAEDKRLAEDVEEPGTADEFGPYLRRILALQKRREPKYRAIEPPAALRRDHRASLDLDDQTVRALQATVDRLEEGGDPAVEARKVLPVLARAVERGNRLARRLGVRKCIAEIPNPTAQPDENIS